MSDGPQGFVSRFGGRINAESAAGAVLAASVLGAVAAFCLTCVTDTDLFWHLATGDLIRRTGHVPTSDTFSYTVYGLPWVDIHWLFQVLVSYLAEVAGLIAVELAKTVLIVGLFAWLYRRGRRTTGAVVAGATLLLAAVACQERFLTRPEIVSWWLLAATLAILSSAGESEPARRRRLLLIGLPLLVLLWVNVQALFILGPVMTALALAAAAGRAVRRPAAAWDGPAAPAPVATELLASLALQAVAALVNPAGPRALRLPFEEFLGHLGGQTLVSQTIAEFRPTLSGYLVTPAIVAFVAFAVLTALVIVADWRRARLFDLLVAGATFYVALRARRNIPLFVIATYPIVLRHAAGLAAGRAAALGRRWTTFAGSGAVTAAAALLIVSVVTNQVFLHPPTERWFGVGLIPDYFPEKSARFVDRARLPGRVFSSLWAGGYLIKRWDRDRRVFIDGRNDPYLNGVLESYLKSIADPEYFVSMVEKYQITAVLWPHQRALEARPLLKWLAEGHGWVMQHLDPGGVVFVRQDVMTPTLVRLERFGSGRPREGIYADLRRQIADEPFYGPPIREIALGEFFSVTGDPQGAAAFLGSAVEALPGSATLRQEYGLALERQEKRPEARAQYEAAVRLDPRLPSAQVALGAMALEDGDLASARAHLDRAWDLGDRSALLLASRARIAETAGRLDDASTLWGQAVAAAPASRGVLLKAAGFRARRGERDAALAIYDRLLRLDPADEEAARAKEELLQSSALGTPRGSRP